MRVKVFGLAVVALMMVYTTTGLQSVRAEPVPDAQAAATDKDPNLATLAYRIGSFRQFLFAAGMTDLDDELKGEGPWTVFAPTDEAIGKLAPGLWFKLLKPENRDMLKRVLRFHMVPGEYPPQRLMGASADVYTIPGAGGPLLVDIRSGSITVEGAAAADEFFAGSNGLLQGVDTVLIPNDLKSELAEL